MEQRAAGKSSDEKSLAERLLAGKTIEKLTGREQKLLLTMRDYLFEQHGKMQNMFKRCDPDGSGHVTIEEFLNAMSRAGVPIGHGLDRKVRQEKLQPSSPPGTGALSSPAVCCSHRPVCLRVPRAAQSDNSITEQEAANIVGFFDQNGDGHLQYHEFMTMLQGTKNSVLTTKVLKSERPGREIH